jgi:glycerol-3-phosphate dehydrogenase
MFLIQHEKIIHLDDFILRRSMLGMLGRVTREAIDDLAGIFSNVLGWDAAQREAEVMRTLSILADKHGVFLSQDVKTM